MDADRTIPLTIANQVLATFGITEPSPLYDRRAKDNALTVADIHEILTAESPFVFGVDWRAALPDELPYIADALHQLGVPISLDIEEDADEGLIACHGHREHVKFVPATGVDFTQIIYALMKIVPPAIEFRASPANGTNDGWEFAVLLGDEWSALEALDRRLVDSLFARLVGP